MIPFLTVFNKITCLKSIPLDLDYNECPAPGEDQKLLAMELLNTLLHDSNISQLEEPLVFLNSKGHYCCRWNTSEFQFSIEIQDEIFSWEMTPKNSLLGLKHEGFSTDSYEVLSKFNNYLKKFKNNLI